MGGTGIFKIQFPLSFFYTFLETICPPTLSLNSNLIQSAPDVSGAKNNYFMIDISAFKRGIFLDAIRPFMQTMAIDYYRSKYAFYAQRPMTGPTSYAQFIQVIRHICKDCKIEMITSLKYEQSLSNKVYYVRNVRNMDALPTAYN